jgi:cytosine/adenosine deaminase-related metal-dependent hydrolase
MTDFGSGPWTLTARWVLPVGREPLAGGSVTVAGDRILAVEAHDQRTPDIDLGNMAVLPGLVNAHTHLDLSCLPAPIPFTGDFTAWLRAVIEHRRSLSVEQVQATTATGLAESLRHGVTLLADISAQGASWPLLAKAPVRAVVFHELLGLTRVRAGQSWAAALAWLHACPSAPTCRPGLSPHAPYSVRNSLFRAAAGLAAERRLPLMIHLAETLAERELLETHSGPFVPFLDRLGVWDADGLVRDLDEIVRLNDSVPRVLYAHGNYLGSGMPLKENSTVVYCPRTHAHFRHPSHHFRALQDRGVRVALGTDSRASNPDLDVLAEARFLHRLHPEVPGAILLHMATLAGAEALGWADETGSLTPGKSADLIVVPLPDHDEPDPHRLVLASDQPVQRVLWRGRWRGA